VCAQDLICLKSKYLLGSTYGIIFLGTVGFSTRRDGRYRPVWRSCMNLRTILATKLVMISSMVGDL
jgi:hypothetical protein